jgi:fatty acid synthase subunit beta
LSSSNIHSLTDPAARKDVLTGYFAALAVLERRAASPEDVPRAAYRCQIPQCLDFQSLGGQGTNEVYFAELKALYEAYKPYVVSRPRKPILRASPRIQLRLRRPRDTSGMSWDN